MPKLDVSYVRKSRGTVKMTDFRALSVLFRNAETSFHLGDNHSSILNIVQHRRDMGKDLLKFALGADSFRLGHLRKAFRQN